MIRRFFRAIRMLGALGLVLIIALAGITGALVNLTILNGDLDALSGTTQERSQYQQAHAVMVNMLFEQIYVLLDEPEKVDATGFEETASEIDEIIVQLDELEDIFLLYIVDSGTAILNYRRLLEEVFYDFASKYDDGSLELEDIDNAIFEQSQIILLMDDLVAVSTSGVEQDMKNIILQRTWSVGIGMGILMLFPLLALWAFASASQLASPLLALANAVTAIGGGHYESDLLENMLRNRNRFRDVARAVDEMAAALKERKNSLEREVETLRDELYETQRSKLTLTETDNVK